MEEQKEKNEKEDIIKLEDEREENEVDDDEIEKEQGKSSAVKTKWIHVSKEEDEGKEGKEKGFETSPDDLD